MRRKKKTIKCYNPKAHGEKLLAVFGKDCVYVLCRDRGCRRWTRISISLPGINLDFSKAGFSQQLLPEGYHLHCEKAAVVIGEEHAASPGSN